LKNAVQWKFHRAAVAVNFDFRAGNFAPVAIHRKSGFANDGGGSGVDEGVEEKPESIVAAVGQKKFFGRDVKMAR
jgi:hypothetical protein